MKVSPVVASPTASPQTPPSLASLPLASSPLAPPPPAPPPPASAPQKSSALSPPKDENAPPNAPVVISFEEGVRRQLRKKANQLLVARHDEVVALLTELK